MVYGHKDGLALTFDVLSPAESNGAGILTFQGGAWNSEWVPPKTQMPTAKPLLDEGYAVFIVRYGSAPKYKVPEVVADVQRCVRFIRMTADNYGVDSERLGAMGALTGGHLTLMLAVTGDDGNPDATDPVLQASSRIACGVALFPPTDLRRWMTDPSEPLTSFAAFQRVMEIDAGLVDEVSPILHVTNDDAPVMLIHQEQNFLIPIEHSRNFLTAQEDADIECELVLYDRQVVVPNALRWFASHLNPVAAR